jgi:hypothetical protein
LSFLYLGEEGEIEPEATEAPKPELFTEESESPETAAEEIIE